jgi:signal peptidase I
VSLGVVVVRGRSMRPTLVDGDRLLVRWGAVPRPGRLVVVRLPDGPAGPRPLSVKRATRRDGDGWWVERDNPDEGVDSWLVGAISPTDVRAVVIGRLWPRPARALRRAPE